MGDVATTEQLSEAIAIARQMAVPLVIKYGAQWCKPCKDVATRFNDLIREFKCEFDNMKKV